MKTYINIEQTQVPSYNLEVVSNAYNKLNEGHIQAIQAQSELQNAVAQLDLNESEDDFRQGLVNEINTTVNENTRYGNAYYALPDIIKKAGDINSNPELIGRLRAQQEYKANIASIDARTDINDGAKEMAKALSPYYYRDKVTGELINNGVWKPGYNPVKSVDYNQVLLTLGQYLSPDKGGTSAPISFLNIDGSISDTYVPGGGLGVLNQYTGQWERLSEEKIQAAWNAAISANPEIMASLRQDYQVANWKYDTQGIDEYNILGRDGSKISFNEFVNRIIDPYTKAKSYYNITSSIQYNDNTLKSWVSLLASNKNNLPNAADVRIQTPGNPVEVENNTITNTANSINHANSVFRNSVAERLAGTNYACDLNNLDLERPEQTRQTLINAGLPVEEIDAIMAEYERQSALIYPEVSYYNQILGNLSERGQSSRRISDAMELGYDIDANQFPDNNSYQRFVTTRGRIIDEAFRQGNIYFGTESADEYNAVIASLGGLQTARSLGYKVTSANGKYYIGLDKENASQFFKFSNAVQNVRNDRPGWENVGNTFSGIFSGKNYTSLDTYYIDENGRISELKRDGNTRGFFGFDSDKFSIFRTADNFRNRMKSISTRKTPDNLNSVELENIISPGGTIEEVNYRSIAAAATDPKLQTLAENLSEQQKANLLESIAGTGLTASSVRKLDDDGKFSMLSGKEIAKIETFLQNEDIVKKVRFNTMFTPTGLYTVVSMPMDSKDKKSIKFILEDVDTPAIREYKNNPRFQTSSNMYMNYVSNKPEQIAFYHDDATGSLTNIMLYPMNDSDKNYFLGYGSEIDDSRIISYEDAVDLKLLYNALTTLNDTDLSYEQKVNTANLYANVLKNMIDGYTDSEGTYHKPIPLVFPNYGSNDYTSLVYEIAGL